MAVDFPKESQLRAPTGGLGTSENGSDLEWNAGMFSPLVENGLLFQAAGMLVVNTKNARSYSEDLRPN